MAPIPDGQRLTINSFAIWFLLPLLSHAATANQEPWWPMKQYDFNRSGCSPHVAPFNLSKPAWVWQEPERDRKKNHWEMQVFHDSPVLDGDLNTYIISTSGWAYSIDRHGRTRWELEMGPSPYNPMLADGVLYTASLDGFAWAIEAETGSVRWKVKVGLASASDASSALVVGDIVLHAFTPENWQPEAHKADNGSPWAGTEEIVALSIADGAEKWRYSVVNRSGTIMYNVAPAVVGDDVLISDMSGGLYRLSLEDGLERWYEPGVAIGTWSTGGFAVGPNNMAYVAANYETFIACNGHGLLRAHDLDTGKVVWERAFEESLNAAPAVGPLRPGGSPVVVLSAGMNTSPAPIPWWVMPLIKILSWRTGLDGSNPTVALDAQTGDVLWTLELTSPSWEVSGVTFEDHCAPDVFGAPTIGADGTVYVNWSGGKVFAVRDANGDGRIDSGDPAELSFFAHGEGSNSNSALAPGYLVAVSCWKVMGFAS